MIFDFNTTLVIKGQQFYINVLYIFTKPGQKQQNVSLLKPSLHVILMVSFSIS